MALNIWATSQRGSSEGLTSYFLTKCECGHHGLVRLASPGDHLGCLSANARRRRVVHGHRHVVDTGVIDRRRGHGCRRQAEMEKDARSASATCANFSQLC